MRIKYDYIITGAGCAGLSLVMRMIASGEFSDKKILLVDKSTKKDNDRTWCFWEKEKGFFESLVFCKWNKFWFHAKEYSALKEIAPYEYKMIRAISFYKHCFDMISSQKNIKVIRGNVDEIKSNREETFAIIDGKKFSSEYIFNSIIFQKPILQKNQYYLIQHFKGWIIQTKTNSFNPEEPVLMNFRTDQQNGTSFFYVMPFSETKALVEYTIFSEKILSLKEYEVKLEFFLQNNLDVEKFEIIEEEFGEIPMTNFNFPVRDNNIIHIGSAGGRTKPSSGYTFQFIQKNSDEIIAALIKKGKPFVKNKKKRFRFYDSVLLNVLSKKRLSGEKIFTEMFRKNDVKDIFDFLDDESNLLQDFRIIKSLPVIPFLQAAKEQLF